ncbi:MAG: MFS transporter [Alphaproteobacteria bacterium]|nr:MFS transporter [Alphaproteobacteria bacterium]
MKTKTNALRKITLWASLGSMVEYYDFVVYAMMAKYLGAVFFESGNAQSAIIQTFLVFAVGYFARPFGGVLFGIIGDVYGRKRAFLALTGLMTVSTLALGLLPSFEKAGILAPILLAICRIMQGLSFGGELPGAATIVGEFSSTKGQQRNQGWFSSLIIASTSMGALVASLVLFLLTTALDDVQIISWGWRLPFIMGGIAGVVLLMGRSKLEETAVFKNQTILPGNPFIDLLKNNFSLVIKGICLTNFFAAMIVVNLYYPYYISSVFGYRPGDVYFATTISLVFSVFALPVLGKMSDSTNKVRMLAYATGSYIVLSFPLFGLLYIGSLWSLILFLIVHQFFIALFGSAYFSVLTTLFHVKIRYTGVAFCYNFVFALMALLPSLLTGLLDYAHTPMVVPLVLSCLAFVSFLSSIPLSDHRPWKMI